MQPNLPQTQAFKETKSDAHTSAPSIALGLADTAQRRKRNTLVRKARKHWTRPKSGRTTGLRSKNIDSRKPNGKFSITMRAYSNLTKGLVSTGISIDLRIFPTYTIETQERPVYRSSQK